MLSHSENQSGLQEPVYGKNEANGKNGSPIIWSEGERMSAKIYSSLKLVVNLAILSVMRYSGFNVCNWMVPTKQEK
jgi:hypothetical protein